MVDLYDNETSVDSPPVVDSLKSTKRNAERCMIRIGNKVVATLPWSVIRELHIEAGTPWSEQLQQQVHEAVAYDKARRSALGTLNRRALSKGEMIFRLIKKGHEESTARKAVDDLEKIGYLNDEEYAQAVLRELIRTKPAGRLLMVRTLFEKRIPKPLATQLIDEFITQQKEQQSTAPHNTYETDEPIEPPDPLTEFVEKKLATMQHLDDTTKARRLFGLLARRGFDYEICRDFVDRYIRHPQ